LNDVHKVFYKLYLKKYYVRKRQKDWQLFFLVIAHCWLRLFVSLYVLFQGKFIRIHFGTNGKIAGADIETCTSTNFKFCIFEYIMAFSDSDK